MSLATRCDACGTIFRVVQDQLKVSDGWVRCGRCQTVFDAQRGLFDLDRESPPPWAPPDVTASPTETSDARETPAFIEDEAAGAHDFSDPEHGSVPLDEFGSQGSVAQANPSGEPSASNLIVDDAAWSQESHPVTQDVDLSSLPIDHSKPADAFSVEPVSVPPLFVAEPGAYIPNESRSSLMGRTSNDTPGDRVAFADRNDFADAQFSPSLLQDDGQSQDTNDAQAEQDAQPLLIEHPTPDPEPGPVPSPAESWAAPAAPPAGRTAEEVATPEFVRRARRIERWQSTESLVALAFVIVVATIALAWQTLHQMRHRIVVQWPETVPLVARYCAVVGCSAQALRRIDDVSIETTGLTQGDAGSGSLRLSVTLRNRAEVPVAMPSLDLSLTGADGELVARRALFPADFRTGNLPLKPAVDTSLMLNFSVTGRKVSGYTVEVFYP
jgi:predicted Zn finger-like uncharacterized protein